MIITVCSKYRKGASLNLYMMYRCASEYVRFFGHCARACEHDVLWAREMNVGGLLTDRRRIVYNNTFVVTFWYSAVNGIIIFKELKMTSAVRNSYSMIYRRFCKIRKRQSF